MRDPRHDAPQEAPGRRRAQFAEPQRIGQQDRPGPHGEDVPDDAPHPGRRPLERLDGARMVVGLDLEGDRPAVADVDDAGVFLARLDEDPPESAGRPPLLGREPLQERPRVLVGAVLRPHDREDAQLGQRRVAPEGPPDDAYSSGRRPCFFTSSGVIGWLSTGSGLGGRGRLMRGRSAAGNRTDQDGAATARPSWLGWNRSKARSGCGIMPKTLPALVADAGDVVQRAVGVVRVAQRGSARWPRAAPARPRRCGSCPRRGRSAARIRAPSVAGLKDGVLASTAQRAGDAAVFERGVADQRPRQEARLAQDLEAVADAEDQPAAGGKVPHRLHDRREPRDGAAPQVVAVGEPARHDHEVGVAQARVLVPHVARRAARGRWQRGGTRPGRSWSREIAGHDVHGSDVHRTRSRSGSPR